MGKETRETVRDEGKEVWVKEEGQSKFTDSRWRRSGGQRGEIGGAGDGGKVEERERPASTSLQSVHPCHPTGCFIPSRHAPDSYSIEKVEN
ncbi:hypothetical protein Pmani_014734 [Petrolisthes manimaculis]|uniref:Uncharacterized protein n=1 Tax=Petrolisthes manimaculis TaxID=1843537 RepID=A0AAE1PSB1_9EUCA|nr:hypothetical protein Pmani_014734 [Petrolisthes manimaculis]